MTTPHPLEAILPSVRKPSRYLGGELFAVHKDPTAVRLRFALAFPDLYEVGMSYLGLKILYHLLNLRPEVWAERFFTPAPDLINRLKERSLPFGSLESGTPLASFDLIGFSLPYELGYTNVLAMLSLGGIPLRARHRGENQPVVLAGGPCTFNPEPLADFFEALVIGDGEEVIQEIVDRGLRWKAGELSRTEYIRSLASLEGIYVPSVHHPESEAATAPRVRIRKRLLADLEQADYPAVSPLPFHRIIHDRLSVEVARGCTRGCRFCQAGFIYRPVRERPPERIWQLLEEGLQHSGYDEATLLSLSTGDYACLDRLLPALMEHWAEKRVALSLPSLRVDTLHTETMNQILRVRKTGFTLAPEAGTQRLRDLINKNLREEEILATVQSVFRAGWRVLKLYFMIGLPTETLEDLQGLIALVKQIQRAAREVSRSVQINVALSTFVPKPHTPFQWAAQLTPEESRERIGFLQKGLRSKSIQVKWNEPRLSFLEGLLSRGDRRTGAVIEAAFRNGALLDAWGEYFNGPAWDQALLITGTDFQGLFSPRDPEGILPWDFVDTGVSRDYLLKEYRRGLEGSLTPDCRRGPCQDCGLCTERGVQPRIYEQCHLPPAPKPDRPPREAPLKKFRLSLSKIGSTRFLSHLEWKEALIRAFRRADLPLVFSQGFHPLPRVAFGPALPVGLASRGEWVDVNLAGVLGAEALRERLTPCLFPGTELRSVEEVPLNSPLPREECRRYQTEIASADLAPERLQAFYDAPAWPVLPPGKKGDPVDLRPLIDSLEIVPQGDGRTRIGWTLLSGAGLEIRPEFFLETLLGREGNPIAPVLITKMEAGHNLPEATGPGPGSLR